MSERYKPKNLLRARQSQIKLGVHHDPMPTFRPEPRDQVVWRDGKSVTLSPMLCRLHGQPWQICTKCSKTRR